LEVSVFLRRFLKDARRLFRNDCLESGPFFIAGKKIGYAKKGGNGVIAPFS
jgi:hypothetical protein